MAKGSKSTSQSRRKKRRKPARELDALNDPSPVPTPHRALNYNNDRRAIDYFAKEWSTEFETKRNHNELPWADISRDYNAVSEGIGVFLEDIEYHGISSSEAKEIADFVGGAKLEDLKSASGVAGRRKDAWLDDRSSCCWGKIEDLCLKCSLGRERSYDNPMTATALYRSARLQRFGLEKTADADRRLMYISNLDPYYILALAETADIQEREALIDAIWNHLTLQTMISVKISFEGFAAFRFELHLPHLELRKSPPKKSVEAEIKRKPDRKWTDLSLFNAGSSKSGGNSSDGIIEVQFSFVLRGTANKRWAGYGFDDYSQDEDDNYVESQIYPCDGLHTDPIAKRDADLPLWCPREYFLLILKTRAQDALKEWRKLVRMIEIRVNEYKGKHSSLLSQDVRAQGEQTADSLRQTCEWTQETTELLSYLLQHISGTIKAWDNFILPTGDIGCFSAMDSGLAGNPEDKFRLYLGSIKETMENMANLEQKLNGMHKTCRNSAKLLQLKLQFRLDLEANAAVQSNAKITHFMVSIITPLTLTIAYFSIPQGSIPFKLEGKYFPVANFLMMGAIQLLFLAICALPSWWRGLRAMTRMLTRERVAKVLEWVMRAGKGRNQGGEQGRDAMNNV